MGGGGGGGLNKFVVIFSNISLILNKSNMMCNSFRIGFLSLMICKLKEEIKRRNSPMTAEYSSTTNIGYNELILSIYVLALNIIYM